MNNIHKYDPYIYFDDVFKYDEHKKYCTCKISFFLPNDKHKSYYQYINHTKRYIEVDDELVVKRRKLLFR